MTIHNVSYQLTLMAQVREALKRDEFPQFVKKFFKTLYHGDEMQYPQWAVDALRSVGIGLLEAPSEPA